MASETQVVWTVRNDVTDAELVTFFGPKAEAMAIDFARTKNQATAGKSCPGAGWAYMISAGLLLDRESRVGAFNRVW